MPSEITDQIISGYGLTLEEAEAMKAAGAATYIGCHNGKEAP
jgi:hypothetical protein